MIPVRVPGFLVIIGVLFVFAYLRPIALIFHNPFSYHFSHGLLILGIIFYMLWCKRAALKRIDVHPNIVAGLIISLLGSAMLMVGIYNEAPIVEGVAFIVGVVGIVLIMFGSGYLKALAFPIFFLNFLFPIFDKILASYSPYLERIAAMIGGHFLMLSGMQVTLNDRVIGLPHITLIVVQACNGINHIIALMALVIFMGFLRSFSFLRVLIYVVVAAAVGILANGLRIGLIGIWTKFFGADSFHGPYNLFYSTFVFLAGFIVLGILMHTAEKGRERKKGAVQHLSVKGGKVALTLDPKVNRIAFAVAVVLLLSTWAFPSFVRPVSITVERDMNEFPLRISSWQGRDVETLKEPYEETWGFDSLLKRIYQDPFGNRVNLFIGYLDSQRKDREIDDQPKGILVNSVSKFDVEFESADDLSLEALEYNVDNAKHEAVYFYFVNGRIISHRYKARIATILSKLQHRKTNAAIILISFSKKNGSPNWSDEEVARKFIGELIPVVQTFLS